MRLRALAFAIGLTLLLSAPPAGAGDASTLEVLGASRDGRHVAFMQSGSQDGSGSQCAGLDVFDVLNDRRAAGFTPIALGGREGDTLSLATLKRQARDRSAPAFKQLKLAPEYAGLVLLSHPLTDIGVDSLTARVSVWPQLEGMTSQELRVTLTPLALGGGKCYFSEQAFGLALTMRDAGTSHEVTLHRDRTLTEQDGCPLAYRIGEVRLPGAEPEDGQVSGRPVLVFVQVFSTGFEGHDMRWRAVGSRLP